MRPVASEFELIARYFTRPARRAVLGIGDDAALLRARAGHELAVSTDMLVAGTHFFTGADPRRLGHKALAVNLSDLAAMGAEPRWVLLSVALPEADDAWLRAFAAGFLGLARKHGVDLVGGDTTRGPLNLCVTIIGEVPRGQALRRDAARAGDEVWVSGVLGDAALAVAHGRKRLTLTSAQYARCHRALELPRPRLALGAALRKLAHAAIDLSDGLVADLGHICERSALGADIGLERVPKGVAEARGIDATLAREAVLAGGDDYELCFTAHARAAPAIERIGRKLGLRLTRIGVMRRGRGVRVLGPDGRPVRLSRRGFDHFG